MAKDWKKAIATYHGGKSYTFRGTQFRENRPVTIMNKETAKRLERKRSFSVQHEFTETDEPKPATKPVKKKRARGGE